MAVNNIIGRADVNDAMMPDQVINEILQTTPEDSVVMSRARNVRMSAKKAKQPVLASAPDAYWVDGDTGLKQTSEATWTGINITAEELAVIVPIPDAVVDDSNVPLWEQVRPLLKEAIGKAVDQAALFGVSKPASWPAGIVPAAIAAGNVAQLGAANPDGGVFDLASAFLAVAEKASVKGISVNGFAARPGLNWKLRGLKDTTGQYLFGNPTEGGGATLFGHSLDEVRNGAWNAAAAEALAIDWSKFVIGIRQDITYDLFSEGVISDTDGKVILNLMQQDTKALRVVMRVGFQVAQPRTRLDGGTFAYPAGVVTPKAGG
ncbi:MAG TPA: phage major capsid protein [Micropruina sp.]|nr:phage major capsid protein [Micropruina sp.]HMR20970.1 phage major capsid protein [Micropruina sp.]